MSEARTDRYRRSGDLDRADREGSLGKASNPTKLVKTVTVTTYPTSPNVTYGVVEVRSSGVEKEGYPITITVIGQTFYAQIKGAKVPPVGTEILVTLTEGRWVGRYG